MKIAIAQVWQETNTFSPVRTDLKAFQQNGMYFGQEILEEMRGVGELGGFLAAGDQQRHDGVQWVPTLRAWAMSSGKITDKALNFFHDTIVLGLKNSMPVDGILVSMHGAAASERVDDVEGHLLSATRTLVGEDIPIVLSLDHHANITKQMTASVDALVGYRTQPHDPLETGIRAARLMFACLEGEVSPCMAWKKIPMIAPADRGRTAEWPMKAWFGLAREIEQRPGVISCSTFPVQPWLDAAELGWAAVVVTNGDPELADRYTAELAGRAWELRDEFWAIRRVSPGDAIRRAVEATKGPVIICDASDSVLSGAPGDSTCLLSEMLKQGITCTALVPMVDPEVVRAAVETGEGGDITVETGGKLDTTFSQPVKVTGKVSGIADSLKPTLHWGASEMGRTVLMEIGSIKMVVSECGGTGGTDPEIYRHFGLEPAEAKMVVVKTYFHYQHFLPIMADVLMADCPGLSMWDLKRYRWSRISHPLFPLDDLPNWEPFPSS